MPQINKSALIKKAISSIESLAAVPINIGTAIAPAYITKTCCKPNTNSLLAGSTSSTGATRCCALSLVIAVLIDTSLLVFYQPLAAGFVSLIIVVCAALMLCFAELTMDTCQRSPVHAQWRHRFHG